VIAVSAEVVQVVRCGSEGGPIEYRNAPRPKHVQHAHFAAKGSAVASAQDGDFRGRKDAAEKPEVILFAVEVLPGAGSAYEQAVCRI
jgi:hypothetical protein